MESVAVDPAHGASFLSTITVFWATMRSHWPFRPVTNRAWDVALLALAAGDGLVRWRGA